MTVAIDDDGDIMTLSRVGRLVRKSWCLYTGECNILIQAHALIQATVYNCTVSPRACIWVVIYIYDAVMTILKL